MPSRCTIQVSSSDVCLVEMIDKMWLRTGDDNVVKEFYDAAKRATIHSVLSASMQNILGRNRGCGAAASARAGIAGQHEKDVRFRDGVTPGVSWNDGGTARREVRRQLSVEVARDGLVVLSGQGGRERRDSWQFRQRRGHRLRLPTLAGIA